MSSLRAALIAFAAISVAACAAAPSAALSSGLEGTVQVAPTCPVERITSPCPARPLATTVLVFDVQGRQVARAQSGNDGHFKIAVAPGRYTVVGASVAGAVLPRPIPMTAVVTAGQFTTITVEYDSGIR